MKSAAAADFAFEPDAAAHEFHQLGGNSQTQSGAAEFPRHRVVGLCKRIEDLPLLVGGDPDSPSTVVAFAMYDGTRRVAFPALPLPPRRPLIRHRLLFESLAVPNRPDAVGAFKVFEVVAGARIRGRARPGARGTARLGLRTNRGRSLVYENGASADGAGRWEIPVPYANRGQPGSTAVGDSYSILCEGEQRRVIVTEAAVQQGLAVVGPRLCGADEAGSATPRGPEAARRGVL